jgi:hypothetical protein
MFDPANIDRSAGKEIQPGGYSGRFDCPDDLFIGRQSSAIGQGAMKIDGRANAQSRVLTGSPCYFNTLALSALRSAAP